MRDRKILQFLFVFYILFLCNIAESQIIINEVSNKNSGQVADEDNEEKDWIELYNKSASPENLSDYFLSDDSSNIQKWTFPPVELNPGVHLLVFASGKNRYPVTGIHWESPVLPGNIFNYIVPTDSTSAEWNQPGFNPVGWKSGKAGFGYSDDDDSSVVETSAMVVYVLKTFALPEEFAFSEVSLDVDYDDGFVAWLNGKEIARAKISGTPGWNTAASGNHEATMYSGGNPEKFTLDANYIKSILVSGTNVFAIEVHNTIGSPDLSLIPFFSFLVDDSVAIFDKSPGWLFPGMRTNYHSNFKIDSKGETVFLYNKKELKLDSIQVRNLGAGWSLGRTTDGADTWGIFAQPTPSLPNSTKAYSLERESVPVFSLAEGFYTGTQNISLSSASATSEIHYTLDGSEPLKTSARYNGIPVSVSSTRIIRACSFSTADKLQSPMVANSYFINANGHSLPVLSISTNNSNLFGGSGIFDNWQQEWEKPCYVEYFDASGLKQFEQSSGIQVDGGAGGSRSNPQHSFRLEFSNNAFGDGELDYMLIPDSPGHKKYKSVYLRNGSNQWLTFQFKDAMECKMMSYETNNYYSACTPVVVYINGAYFGLYEMREKLNDEFFEQNAGASIDSSFNLLSLSYYYQSVLRALNGSVDTFINDYNSFLKLNPAGTTYLEKADQILDLKYYTDYIIAQSWIADTDWPFNNIKIVKGDFTDYRWRFILQDLEWALNPNGWSNSGTDHINYMKNYDPGVPYLRFWKELMKNSKYKRDFINRFADLMNSSYLTENTHSIAQSVYDASFPEMRNEYVRWGGGESQADSRMNQYIANMATFKSELEIRSANVRSNIVSNYGFTRSYSIEMQVQPTGAGNILINTITPEVYPWTGIYFAGNPIRLEAKAYGNYVFDGWEPNTYIKDLNNPVIEADVKLSGYKFTAKFKKLTPDEAIIISEINYSSSDLFPTTDWIELYNYGVNTVNLSGWYIRDDNPAHKWVILGSYILKPNERLVLASDINKFNNTYPDVQNVMGSFGFGLGSPSDSVLLFNSSNKLVAGMKYSNSDPWPAGPFDSGLTLELKDPYLSLNSAQNWFAGCLGGSPGTAFIPCSANGTGGQVSVTGITVYPNPASSLVNIVLPSDMNAQEVTCRIFDIMGREVRTELIHSQVNGKIELSVENLFDGIYILQVSDDRHKQNIKFVKRNE